MRIPTEARTRDTLSLTFFCFLISRASFFLMPNLSVMVSWVGVSISFDLHYAAYMAVRAFSVHSIRFQLSTQVLNDYPITVFFDLKIFKGSQ